MENTIKEKILNDVAETKSLRKAIDESIQALKNPTARRSAERTLALRKLQEGVMWLGMDLKAIKEENPDVTELHNPYPASYDASSPSIEKTADNLKL